MFFKRIKLLKQTKNDIKRAKKEKIRCQKLYPDWKDDEYNCGPLKYIWGIRSSDDLSGSGAANFSTLNDLDIYYNRDTNKYILALETMYVFENNQNSLKYLENLLKAFNNYLENNYLFDVKYDPFFLYVYNNGDFFSAESITELYYKFKIFVKGYGQL